MQGNIWEEVVALDFISDGFSWFFMLLTRLAEPFMLLATLYVIAETGVPAIAVSWVHALAIGIMITAPELILPGSFVVASHAQDYRKPLFLMCGVFILLTALTLVSLFVWHLSGDALAWLMCARCIAAVAYSILMRVMSHGNYVQTMHAVEQKYQEDMHMLNESVSVTIDHFTSQLVQIQQEMRTQLDSVHSEKVSSVQQEKTPVHLHTVQKKQSVKSGKSVQVDRQKVSSILQHNPDISIRTLAKELAVSPTTATKYKQEYLQKKSG